jgi:GT2 family glycosyltransferase
VPQSKVVHYGGQSTQQVATEMFLHLYKSKVQFFRKHYGGMAAYTYKLILTVASMARLSLSPLALLEQPSRRRHHLSLAQNYGRLLAALLSM